MQWKPIPNTSNSYSASNTGRIRRDKPVKGNHKAGKEMNQGLDKDGYPRVPLSVDGVPMTRHVHRLVALAFLGPPPSKTHQVNHKNGIKTDNRLSNLEWCTIGYNACHALRTGLKIPLFGSKVGGSKLTETQAQEIVNRASKEKQRSLAKEFNISESNVSMIVNRITWKHLKPRAA